MPAARKVWQFDNGLPCEKRHERIVPRQDLAFTRRTGPVVGVAESSVMIASAAFLRLITHNATELFVGHALNASSYRYSYPVSAILGHQSRKINRSRLLAQRTNP